MCACVYMDVYAFIPKAISVAERERESPKYSLLSQREIESSLQPLRVLNFID